MVVAFISSLVGENLGKCDSLEDFSFVNIVILSSSPVSLCDFISLSEE